MIAQVQGTGISTEQQKKNWLINWYFENDPTSSIYLATLRNPALVASYQTSPGMLYGTSFATGMENYFIKIKTHFGQSMFDQLVTEFAQQSNLYVDEIKVDEWHIYGSSRLGVYEANRTISKRVARDLNNDNQITNNEYVIETPEEVMYLYSNYQLERGAKRYELANHLSNVLTVISDKKTANFTGTTFTNFTAERISATDYSPFGAPLAGRTWNAGEYRFGFNTQERDDEIAGVGNITTAEFWEYDARLGRRWNLDPVLKYWESSYSTFSNNPIFLKDHYGNDTTGGFVNNEARDDFNNTYYELNNRINNIKGSINNLESKSNLSKKELKILEKLNGKLTDYLKIKEAFDELISNKEVKFRFHSSINFEGGNTTEEAPNVVFVAFERKSMGTLVHEIRHCFGYIHKEWNKESTDYIDELEGWNFHMIWDEDAVRKKNYLSSQKVNIEQQMNFNIYRMIELEYPNIINKDWIQHKVE